VLRPAPAAQTAAARTLTQWLRSRSDEDLGTLLRRRPDLGLPAPADIATLASRIAVRTSVQRAVDSLDAWRLRVLEALVLSAADDSPPSLAAATELLGGADRGADVSAALADLGELALIWGELDDLHLSASVPEALGTYPAGLGRPAAVLLRGASDVTLAPVLRSLDLPPSSQPRSGAAIAAVLSDPDEVGRLIAGTDDDERAVLERLADGPPVGLVRNAASPVALDGPGANSAAGSPAPKRLIARGLLIAVDAQSVELPREVGVALRAARSGAPLGAVSADPPPVRTDQRSPADADRAGTTAVLDLLRQVQTVADDWTQHPPAVLRTGGVGVRELRRTTRVLNVAEPIAALVIELAASAGLIAATNGIDPTYLPTPEFDTWVRREPEQRWVTLATAWLAMTRQPSLIGQRDERERLITVLGPDAERGTVPSLRRSVLSVLATLAPGVAPAARDEVLDRLAWEAPRRASAQRRLVEAILAEADAVGITAAGGLTSYGRAVLSDAAAAARDAVAIALPEPVDHFVVQPDLTVVVPGPPTPQVARELALVADLESVGGASVYRITETSIRRALDAGSSAATLTAMLSTSSRTPLPQGLTYLIDDVARRHGVLRTGAAGAYLRCDDESLLARVLADRSVRPLGLRLIASTVAISTAPVSKVLDALRAGGYAPAAEAADGVVVSLVDDAPRAPTRVGSRLARARPSADLDAHATELVHRIRAGDAVAERERAAAVDRARASVSGWQPGMPIPGITSATTLGLLRGAIRAGQRVSLGYVDADGQPTRHTILPISMAGGTLRGHDPSSRQLEAYALHRITDVALEPGSSVE
jgi:hypothetical protein